MSSDSKADFASFFKPSKSRSSEVPSAQNAPSTQNRKDLLKDGYLKSNQSLILKVHRLEAEVMRSRKIIEELRAENASLRKKICDTEQLDNDERIEALVEERIKRKMDQLSCISSRTVTHLQKAALSLKEAFEDFGVLVGTSSSPPSEKDTMRIKRSTLSSEGQPSLVAVAESPPLVTTRVRSDIDNKENREALEDGTPSRTQSCRKKSRRSELFRIGQSEIREISEDTALNIPEVSPLQGSPTPTNTPPVVSKRPFFETPAVPFTECDTIRRKRTATLKIKSMVEPKLNNKLRRPGRNDEPHPFISSLY